jgi:hypothetical protein
MPNYLQKIIDLLVAVILMFLIPALYFNIKKDAVIQVNVDRMTTEFVETVAADGYVTREMYEKYLERLANTDKLYEVELIHEQTAFEPEYILRSSAEVIEEDEGLWTGTNEYLAPEVVTEKPVVPDPINTGSLNTETNESVLAKAKDTPADPNHVHTDECYAGHKHTGDKTFAHTHQHTSACLLYEQAKYADVKCHVCGNTSHKVLVVRYWDPDSGEVKVGYAPGGDTSCWVCGSYNTTSTLVSSYAYSCGYNIDINNDGLTDTVGTSQSYQYKMPFPQDKTIKATYTSGCYKYNNSVSVPISANDYYGNPQYFSGQWEQIYLSGLSPYCYVPQDYELKYQWGSGSQAYVSPTFRLKYDNGVATFKYIGGSNMNIYDNFPSVDFQTLRSLSSDGTKLYNYLHANAVQTYIQSGGSASMNKMYGRIQICNDTIHDQWYAACGLEENGVLGCSQLIKEIVPTNPIQTVYTGDPLITTAVATFLDGSTKTVVCTTTFSTTGVVKNQSALLTYTYVIGSVSYSKTCSVTVTVIPRNKICVNGHTYNLNADGSDPGCPYCKNWLRSLAVLVPSSGSLTMYRNSYGSLEMEGVGLIAVYLDGHTEYVYNGYVDNLDPDYVGTQTVTIGYKGLTTSLVVNVVRNRKRCEVCGLYYDLYMDDTDPGCPYCKAKVPVFTGHVKKYTAATYEDEITNELFEGSGIYYFRRGDVFTVRAKSRRAVSVLSLIGRLFGLKINVKCSDTVKNEEVHN